MLKSGKLRLWWPSIWKQDSTHSSLLKLPSTRISAKKLLSSVPLCEQHTEYYRVLFIIAVLANSKCILFVLVCWKCAFVVLLKKENCIIFLFFVISARRNTRRELNLKHQQRLRAGSTSQNATSQPLASNVRHVGHFERYIVVDFMRSFEQLGWARSLFIHVTTEHFLHHSNIFQHYNYTTF